jgi:uncharacterized membrane protein (DUF2068 family)
MSAPTNRIAPWEDFVLRLIAVYKLLHATVCMAVGVGLLHLRHHDVVQVLNTYIIIPYHLDPEGQWVDWTLDKAQMLSPHFSFLGWVAFCYAALFATEGVGLYLRKHWAEYLVVIATGSLLPFEIYELFYHPAAWTVGIVLGNLTVVGYLIHRLILDSRNRGQLRETEKQLSMHSLSEAKSKPVASEVPR